MAKNSSSPWVWIGCGCLGLLAAALVAIGAVVYFGLRTAATMSDPAAAEAKALQVLSADAIPAGYELKLAMTVPMYADLVLLERDDERFMYLEGLRSSADLTRAFDDDEAFDRELRLAGVRIDDGRSILARDAVRAGRADVRYVLVEGEMQFDFDGRAGRRSLFDFDFADLGEAADEPRTVPALGAAVLIRCSDGDEPGLGLWTGSRPLDDAAPDAALVAFIEQFGFCSR